MKSKVRIIIGSIIFILVAFLYAHIAKTTAIYDKGVDTSEYGNTGALIDTQVQQEFMCVENSLDAIRIKCALNGNPQNTFLTYTLEDIEEDKVVAEGEVDASNAKVTKMFEFRFDTVENTANKHYRFTVNPKGASEVGALSFAFEHKVEKNTYMSLNDDVIEGTLILKMVTDRFDMETFIVVLIFGVYIVFFFNFLYKLFRQ